MESMYALSTTCDLKRGLRRCPAPPTGICQYCGRSFCSAHGQRFEDGQEICGRKVCQEKRLDLEQHMEYKAAVAARNRSGFCGDVDCPRRAVAQCSKCQGVFCPLHVESRDDTSGRGFRAVTRRLSLCRHCWARRRLWSRV